MKRTDWLDKGFDASDARFLMVTAIGHHRFRSPNAGLDGLGSGTLQRGQDRFGRSIPSSRRLWANET
jgi:hypothetical protein